MKRALTSAVRRWALAVAATALLGGLAGPAHAAPWYELAKPGPEKPGPGARATSPFNLMTADKALMIANAWNCGLTQSGEVCVNLQNSSTIGGGFWPAGTPNQYIFNSGLQMAGVVGADGGSFKGDTVSSYFFDARGSPSGSPTPFSDGIFFSNDPNDLASWPDACYIDNPVYGHVKTMSQFDTCVQYWDGNPAVHSFPDFGHPMGILVTQHSMAWSFPSNKDILFFSYKFKNVTNDPEFQKRNPGFPAGGYTLTNLYAAFGMDPDVSQTNSGVNFATVVPGLNMATAWEANFEGPDFVPYAPNFDAAPGFVGVKYLKSPLNNSDTTITVRVGAETRVVKPGQQLGLTFFSVNTNGGVMSDPRTARIAMRYLSGKLLPDELQSWCPPASTPPGMCYVDLKQPDDMRFYQTSGPFKLGPGEEAEILVAYVAGAPVPGTYQKGSPVAVGSPADTTRAIEKVMGRGYNAPGFPSLFANAKTAQAIYDANFVLPSPPPNPQVTVIPGDKQNTILWSAAPVTAADPYYRLAKDSLKADGTPNPLFDPNFRQFDFEGFRVYRKADPGGQWVPIAQFDLPNGISEVVTPLQIVTTSTGDQLIIKSDTASVCQPATKLQSDISASPGFAGCTAETGLKFAIIDRGGTFPDPANGPGLINGVRYYYAVTSFAINSPISGPSELEGARAISQLASGVPSSRAPNVTASTATVQLQGANGAAIDTTGTISLDPATGAFKAPIPGTNGLRVSVEAVPSLLTAQTDVTIKVDSVVPGAPAGGLAHQYFLTATGPGGSQKLQMGITPSVTESAINNSATAGLDATKTGFVGSVEIWHPDSYFQANMQRGVVNGATIGDSPASASPSWPRWFVSGAEPAHASDGNQYAWCDPDYYLNYTDAGTYCAAQGKGYAGVLAGYTIAPMIAYSSLTSRPRGFDNVLSGVWRAADIEITWGADGAVTSVQDLSNKVPVPFSPDLRASYGFMTPASFAGVDASKTPDKNNNIITFGDYTCLDPVNRYAIEGLFDFAGNACQSPVPAKLQPKAALVQVNWLPPMGFGYTTASWQGTSSPQTGFSMYINGQVYHFIGNSLPAAGTKWTLRTFTGMISADQDVDANGLITNYKNYKFWGTIRPPNVPGLTVKVSLSPAVVAAATEADLNKIHTVPDPYLVRSILDPGPSSKTLQFVNLPPKAFIRIYSLSGTLIAAFTHDDPNGGGTENWNLRSRNNQFVASGVYFYHVETPEGKSKVGKFTVIQYAQ